MNVLVERAHHVRDRDAFQHDPVEVTEERTAGTERQGITVNHPQYANQREGNRYLSKHGQHVFRADQPAIKQRQARDSHKQHQCGANHHKGVVGFIRYSRRRGGQTRQQRQCCKGRCQCEFFHHFYTCQVRQITVPLRRLRRYEYE